MSLLAGTIPNACTVRVSLDTLQFLRRALSSQQHRLLSTCISMRHMETHPRIAPRQSALPFPRSRTNIRELSHSAQRASELPSNPKTHYDFFPTTLPEGPPPAGRFSIDLRQLRSEFLKLQASAHPDRHPQDRKGAAEALSSRINEAYKTLQSPLLRAQYLLSLQGDDSATDEAAKLGEVPEDQELLMEVLELREQIEEAATDDDIKEIKQENDLRIAESVKILEDAFESDHLADAAKEAVRLRYWMNIEDTCHAWEQGKPPPNLVHT